MSKIFPEKKRLLNDRIDFSTISGDLPLPYLCEIQTKSYEWFKEKGIEEVFREVFPVLSDNKEMRLDFLGYKFGEPKHTYEECKERNLTYEYPLSISLQLYHKETGEIQVKNDVVMGDIPAMTEGGTFVIKGVEKVIVSQLVRSPGAYIKEVVDKNGLTGIEADLIPARGTWLEFFVDSKNLVNVRIDRTKKILATTFFKALGLTEENNPDLAKLDPNKERKSPIVGLFLGKVGNNQALVDTVKKDENIVSSKVALEAIISKLKPGEPQTPEGNADTIVKRFFDYKRYDLGPAGRFKFANKLGIYSRLIDRTLAENLVDANGEVRFTKGYKLTREDVKQLRREEFFEKGAHEVFVNANKDLQIQLNESLVEESLTEENKARCAKIFEGKINLVKVYADENNSVVSTVIGTDLSLEVPCLALSDILAIYSYYLNRLDGFGDIDDIDNLGNRRVRRVGELIQQQVRIGLTKMVKSIKSKMSTSDETTKISDLINKKPLTTSVNEFFAVYQLSQYMEQVNPLAELAHKRKLSAIGPGGIARDRASMEVRDVHFTHYGRICPIETPEGQNIGLINNLATYAKVNQFGFIETPFRKIDKTTHKVLNDLENTRYFSADEELMKTFAQSSALKDHGDTLPEGEIVARRNGENILVNRDDVDYVDVSPKQLVSVAAACIPFLENDDTHRALMGANMQRHALPLLRPSAPFVGTGLEHYVARDSGLAVVAKDDGEVKYVDSKRIVVKVSGEKKEQTYTLQKYLRSNQDSCINQTPIVKVGQKVKKGDIIADGPAMENGELALGQNITIAFMTWEGYNYEDAVIMSERLIKDDTYTSIHIEELDCKSCDTKAGKPEQITRDIPNVREKDKAHLDARGIVIPGTEVKEGDILVGKITPKGKEELSGEQKIIQALVGNKADDAKDTSLRVPHGAGGIVHSVKYFSHAHKDELPAGVNEMVCVYIVQKRKITEGDKLSGRHGNKGVISRILPEQDMPFMEDGTPVDIMLNPLGVPSRMNIGQILEIHLGLACKKLGVKIATPVFDGISNEQIKEMMKEAGIPEDGKQVLYDGRTGERFDEKISVGVMYMIKLNHMVDDKLHARAVGPYSLITQQPLGGKALKGGQRFGEMEVWALEAYGAAHTLQEILTIKSDDRVGKSLAYSNIVYGEELPKPGVPEAFRVLTKELKSLALDVTLRGENGEVIDLDEVAKRSREIERRAATKLHRKNKPEIVEEQDDYDAETVAEEDSLSVRNA